jgi:hypothetical protein
MLDSRDIEKGGYGVEGFCEPVNSSFPDGFEYDIKECTGKA